MHFTRSMVWRACYGIALVGTVVGTGACSRSPLTNNPIDTAVSSRRTWTPPTPTPAPRSTTAIPVRQDLVATFVIPTHQAPESLKWVLPAQTLTRPGRTPPRLQAEQVNLVIQGSLIGQPAKLKVGWQIPPAALLVTPGQPVAMQVVAALWQDHPTDPQRRVSSPQVPDPVIFSPRQITQGKSQLQDLILVPPPQAQDLPWLHLQVHWTSPPRPPLPSATPPPRSP